MQLKAILMSKAGKGATHGKDPQVRINFTEQSI